MNNYKLNDIIEGNIKGEIIEIRVEENVFNKNGKKDVAYRIRITTKNNNIIYATISEDMIVGHVKDE